MDIGPGELIVILFVGLLLFGAKGLPEVARNSGRALRIFRAEVTGATAAEPEIDTSAGAARPAR